MSKAFAEEILNNPDPQIVREKLKQRPNEVDDAFIAHYLQLAEHHIEKGDTGDASSTLQSLYSHGTHAQRPRAKTRALYTVALLEVKLQSYEAAARRVLRCLDECAKAPEQCADVEFEALMLLATLQVEHEGDTEKAIETLQRAFDQRTRIGDSVSVHEIQRRIDLLRIAEKSTRGYQPLKTVLVEITDAHRRLEELQNDIFKTTSQLYAARAEIAGLEGNRAAAATEIADLNGRITSLTTTRDELQSRQRLFATALAAPLWIAAVRADIQAGRISELTLPLLERLRTAMPEHAQPLIAQIRARNSLAPDQPINLDGLAGEERLFAAVANSLTLDPAADPAAFESLLDAWDTYLSTPAGNGP